MNRYELKVCRRKNVYLLPERLEPLHKIGFFEVKFQKNRYIDHVIMLCCDEVGPNSGWFSESLNDDLSAGIIKNKVFMHNLKFSSGVKMCRFSKIVFEKRSYWWRHKHMITWSKQFFETTLLKPKRLSTRPRVEISSISYLKGWNLCTI